MREEQLKPCPFCGSKYIDLWPMSGGWYSPCCLDCGATICENIKSGKDTDKQIEIWNRRKP